MRMIGIYMPLYKGRWNKKIVAYTIVDRELFDILSKFEWHVFVQIDGRRYAIRYDSAGTTRVWLHRTVLNSDIQVDHKNHDTLDNRRENIRKCTNAQNNSNKYKVNPSSSKYKGVSWYKPTNKWKAAITHNYTTIHLGYFVTEREAAKAYNEAAKKYQGEFATLNEGV